MSPLLISAIIVITLALVFYTIGVFSEARKKMLEWKHVGWFAAGLVCDITGTLMMRGLSGDGLMSPLGATLMAVSGTLAVVLMVVHIIFAVIVLKNDVYRDRFHKWSVVIWIIWLISYALGPIGLMV